MRKASGKAVLGKLGRLVPGCFAAHLGDCKGKLSGEHIVSKNILGVVATKGMVKVSGPEWLRAPEKALPISGLEARVLCERHNSALSPLDAEAGRLFRTIHGIEEWADRDGANEHLQRIDGNLLQRWALKTMCGALYSGMLLTGRTAATRLEVNTRWVDMAFGRRPFAAWQGLAFFGRLSDDNTPRGQVHIQVLTLQEAPEVQRIVGCQFLFNGLRMLLQMDPAAPAAVPELAGASVVPHPEAIQYAWPDRPSRVIFVAWDPPPGHGRIIGLSAHQLGAGG